MNTQSAKTMVQSGAMQLGRHTQSRVLVVNDEPGHRMLMQEIRSGPSYNVTKLSCGEDSLSLLNEQPLNAHIRDVYMPDMDGAEACRRIRGETGRNYASENHRDRQRRAGRFVGEPERVWRDPNIVEVFLDISRNDPGALSRSDVTDDSGTDLNRKLIAVGLEYR